MQFRTLSLNGQPLTKLVDLNSGAVIFNALPYDRLLAVISRGGNAFVETNQNNNFEMKYNARMYPYDNDGRGLFGFGAGKSAYMGCDGDTFEIAGNLSDRLVGTDCREINQISWKFESANMTISIGDNTVTDGGRIVGSNTLKFPKNIGSSYLCDVVIYDYQIIDLEGNILSDCIPVRLNQDIVNGSKDDIGFWDILNNVFIPNIGTTTFKYLESSTNVLYDEIEYAVSGGGSFINTLFRPECNDNFEIKFKTNTSSLYQSNGVQRLKSGTIRLFWAQTSETTAGITMAKFDNTRYENFVPYTGEEVIIVRGERTQLVVNDVIVVTDNRSSNRATLPLFIGALNNDMSAFSPSASYLGRAYFEDRTGTPKVEFVPIKIRGTNEIAWLEKIEGVIYGTNGGDWLEG